MRMQGRLIIGKSLSPRPHLQRVRNKTKLSGVAIQKGPGSIKGRLVLENTKSTAKVQVITFSQIEATEP